MRLKTKNVHLFADGVSPFGVGQAPLMSHWVADLVPYFWCCAWSDFTTCRTNYADKRPTPDCAEYDPPGLGKNCPYILLCECYLT